MQLRRSVLMALMIILFIYFEIHSCSRDTALSPQPPVEIPSILLNANDIFFIDQDHGWVCGQNGTMIRTVDGGGNWQGVRIDDTDITSISFIDLQTGWVVGKGGRIYKSDDGGATWNRRLFPCNPDDEDLFQIVFRNEQDGFIQGYHGVFVSNTGGDDWENHWLPVVPSRGAWNMCMIDDMEGYLLGSRWSDSDPELLYRTGDGGITWAAVQGSEVSVLKSIMEIEFIDDDIGFAGGGTVMKTLDGGGTWEIQLDEATVREFNFLDYDYGFAVGGRAILKTTNGGSSWIDITPADDRIVDLRGVYFLDRQTGWVVGRGHEEIINDSYYKFSIVLKTVDGGESWALTEFGYNIDLLGQEMDTVEGEE
ncbi:MAG: hypothetical protein JW814_08845 [Candidatus Krumholzibacteriota bacterium]|nr:hypothetical protein [Candidatus Krumholzibacteriota bacterium]